MDGVIVDDGDGRVRRGFVAGVEGEAAASVEQAPVDLAQNKAREKSHGCARGKQRGWEGLEGFRSTVLTGVQEIRRRQWRTAAADCGQPGGVLARVFGGFERGFRGGLYGGIGTEDTRSNRNQFEPKSGRVSVSFSCTGG